MSKTSAALVFLCFLAVTLPVFAAPPARPPATAAAVWDLTGDWEARIMGQTVTVNFTQNGSMVSGLLVLPDITGTPNTYHLSGSIAGDFFATAHGSGHLLRGWLRGADEAKAELTLKDAQPITFTMRRVR